MIFKDLSKFKVKFYFDEEDHSAWVELVFITDEMTRKAREKFIKNDIEYQVNPKTKALERFRVTDADTEGLSDWSVCNGVSDWAGLQWEGGVDIECTDENKISLYRNQPAFKKFLDDSWKHLNEIAVTKFGSSGEEKNSEST